MAATKPPPKPKSTTASIIAFVCELCAAGILGYAAWSKFAATEDAVAMFTALGMEPGGRILIGVLEAIAAVALLIPASGILGAALGSAVMTGAIIAHLTVLELKTILMAVVVLVLCTTIIFLRRHQSEFFRNMFDR